MAARAISSATISFGLVSIPIKIYSTQATDKGIRFNYLSKKSGARLKQQYICSKTQEVVTRDEMIKGYEFSKGQYVTFTDKELKALEAEANRALEIAEFLPIDEIDPLYFEKTYYLGPDVGGERPYVLLRAAMRQTGFAAVARYAARGKQYTVLIRPFEDGLAMQQLRYADEIKPFKEIPLGEAEAKAQEIQLAVQLIEQISSDKFRPHRYKDEVKARMQEAVELKIKGQEVTFAEPQSGQGQVIDLMQALKASLGIQNDDAPKPAKSVSKKKKTPRTAAKG